jgi:hypothetical protein
MKVLVNILVFLIFVVLVFGAGKVAQVFVLKGDLYLVISSILFATMLFAVLQIMGSKSNEGFFFEVSPAKKCCGGPYMYSSDPERQELCSKISPEELSRVCCGAGYVGRPMRVTGCKGSMNQVVNETSY